MQLDRDALRFHGEQNEAFRFERSGHPLVDMGMFSDCWHSPVYTVLVRVFSPGSPGKSPEVLHISIKRNDKDAIRDWRHLQVIKNCIVGFEGEAAELYPAESRLNDEANQYHLYAVRPPEHFYFGDIDRHVGTPEEAEAIGARQRDFEPGTRVPKSVRSRARRRGRGTD